MGSEWAEQDKFKHASVSYVPDARETLNQTTIGDECRNCANFVKPNRCLHVKTPISPAGWCEQYEEA